MQRIPNLIGNEIKRTIKKAASHEHTLQMTSNKYHESTTIILKAGQEWTRKELHAFLIGLGFESEDDFYYYQRTGTFPIWQATNLLSIDVHLKGAEVYETKDDVAEGNSGTWDALVAEYLMASLPKELIASAVEMLFGISEEFSLQVLFGEKPVTRIELLRTLDAIAGELSANFDEPGSETLAILIELEYGRNR
jgi:hypothetical protein